MTRYLTRLILGYFILAVLRGIERTFGLMGLFVIVGSVLVAVVTSPVWLRLLVILFQS